MSASLLQLILFHGGLLILVVSAGAWLSQRLGLGGLLGAIIGGLLISPMMFSATGLTHWVGLPGDAAAPRIMQTIYGSGYGELLALEHYLQRRAEGRRRLVEVGATPEAALPEYDRATRHEAQPMANAVAAYLNQRVLAISVWVAVAMGGVMLVIVMGRPHLRDRSHAADALAMAVVILLIASVVGALWSWPMALMAAVTAILPARFGVPARGHDAHQLHDPLDPLTAYEEVHRIGRWAGVMLGVAALAVTLGWVWTMNSTWHTQIIDMHLGGATLREAWAPWNLDIPWAMSAPAQTDSTTAGMHFLHGLMVLVTLLPALLLGRRARGITRLAVFGLLLLTITAGLIMLPETSRDASAKLVIMALWLAMGTALAFSGPRNEKDASNKAHTARAKHDTAQARSNEHDADDPLIQSAALRGGWMGCWAACWVLGGVVAWLIMFDDARMWHGWGMLGLWTLGFLLLGDVRSLAAAVALRYAGHRSWLVALVGGIEFGRVDAGLVIAAVLFWSVGVLEMAAMGGALFAWLISSGTTPLALRLIKARISSDPSRHVYAVPSGSILG